MRYNIEEFINDVLTELSFRNTDGIPNLTRESDLNELYSILEEYEIPYSVIDEFIQKLTETVDLTDTARNTIASKGLEHMGYGYYGKNDEVMYKKNEKGDLVPSTDDSYKKDVEDQQKKAGNVDKDKDGKQVKPTSTDGGEEPQTEPKSVFKTSSGESYIEELPDNDPAKPKKSEEEPKPTKSDTTGDDSNKNKPQPNKLTDSDDPDSDGDIKQLALNYGTKNANKFKPAPGNVTSMAYEILSGEVKFYLEQNPNMTDDELAEAIYNQIKDTELGKEMGSADVELSGKYKGKNKKLLLITKLIAKSGRVKYERTKEGINNLISTGKLSEPIKTRSYYGHEVSKKKQIDLITKLKGPFYTREGVEIPKDELLNFIKNSGAAENPSDTATISVDSEGRAMIQFHSDKMTPADIQANSTTKQESENSKKLIQESNLSEEQKLEAIRIIDEGQSALDNKEKELNTAANEPARRMADGDISKILSDIKSDRGITGRDKISSKLKSLYSKGNPHPNLLKYLPTQDEPYTEEQVLKAFYQFAGDENRTGELTSDQKKLLYRSAKQQGYDISKELGRIRQESIDIQRETHNKLNQSNIKLSNGESKPIGDYIEAINIIDKLHIGVVDGSRSNGVGKYPGLFDVNMGGTIVEPKQLKHCLDIEDTDDFITHFEVGTPDEKDVILKNKETGAVTGRNVFVYAITKSGKRIKVAYKTQRSKQGESGKLDTTYQWDKETQECFKKNQ